MKNYLFAFLTAFSCFSACRHEEAAPLTTCVEQFLTENNLVAYTGQDLGCKFYASLFELGEKEYFYIDHSCADMISIPVDCAGNPYCANIDSPELAYFFANAVFIRVVGVRP